MGSLTVLNLDYSTPPLDTASADRPALAAILQACYAFAEAIQDFFLLRSFNAV